MIEYLMSAHVEQHILTFADVETKISLIKG